MQGKPNDFLTSSCHLILFNLILIFFFSFKVPGKSVCQST